MPGPGLEPLPPRKCKGSVRRYKPDSLVDGLNPKLPIGKAAIPNEDLIPLLIWASFLTSYAFGTESVIFLDF